MTAAGETISTMSTGDVAFAGDKIAGGESFDMVPHTVDHSNEFVADGYWNGDRLLRPGVPVIYMYVRSADGRFKDANENIVTVGFRDWNFFEPKPRLGAAFHDGFHCLLHV